MSTVIRGALSTSILIRDGRHGREGSHSTATRLQIWE